jgi:phage gp46-like protein
MTDVYMDFCECVDAQVGDCADLSMTDDLQNAVMISLFTNSRAREDDPLPNQNDRGGYWGTAIDGNNGGADYGYCKTPEIYPRHTAAQRITQRNPSNG